MSRCAYVLTRSSVIAKVTNHQISPARMSFQIPALPRAIARSRALHGIPITDVNLPSSWAAFEQGVEIKGHSNSILVFKL